MSSNVVRRIREKMRLRGRRAATVMSTAVLGVVLVACGSSKGPSTVSSGKTHHVGSIVVGFSPQNVYMPFYFAVKQGFLAAQGITATLSTYPSGVEQLDAVLTGQADVTGNGQYNIPLVIAKGGHIETIAEYATSGYQFGAVATGSITRPQDLIGKTVGTQEGGSSTQYYFQLYLKHYGIPASEVHLVNIKYAELVPALKAGSISAFFAFQPYLSAALSSVPGAHILNYSGQDNIFPLYTFIGVSPKIYSDPTLAEAFLRGMIATENWMNTNPAKVYSETQPVIQAASLTAAAAAMKIFTFKINLAQPAIEAVSQVENYLVSQKLVSSPQPMDKLINASFLRAVDPSVVAKDA